MIILDAHIPPSLASWIAAQYNIECPLKVIWLTCGNTSKDRLREILSEKLLHALALLEQTDLVEITGY
jgi:predicted nuclease of predicted toxin-antitoxin system